MRVSDVHNGVARLGQTQRPRYTLSLLGVVMCRAWRPEGTVVMVTIATAETPAQAITLHIPSEEVFKAEDPVKAVHDRIVARVDDAIKVTHGNVPQADLGTLLSRLKGRKS